jgi:uncharacterized membrane protein
VTPYTCDRMATLLGTLWTKHLFSLIFVLVVGLFVFVNMQFSFAHTL